MSAGPGSLVGAGYQSSGCECGHVASHQSRRTGVPIRPVACWSEWRDRTPACRALPEVRLGRAPLGRSPAHAPAPGSHPVGGAAGYVGLRVLLARAVLGISPVDTLRVGLSLALFLRGNPSLEGLTACPRSQAESGSQSCCGLTPAPGAPLCLRIAAAGAEEGPTVLVAWGPVPPASPRTPVFLTEDGFRCPWASQPFPGPFGAAARSGAVVGCLALNPAVASQAV